MRAVLLDGPGDAIDVLRVAEMPRPAPGPGQVLIRLIRRPINPADLLFIAGRYGGKPSYPAIPGNEGVGVVEALGEGVNGPAPGTRVVPLNARSTWQDAIVHPAEAVVAVPDSVGDDSAAQLVANPLAAWIMLFEELDLPPGSWLAQSAASSALGRLVIQLAKKHGLRTINLVRRREQRDMVRAWGGDEAICTADEDVVERIRAITGGMGVAGALDAVGGATGTDLVKSLGSRGTMLVHGVLDGRSIAVHPGWLLSKGATLRGFWLRHWFATRPVAMWRDLASQVLARVADGTMTLTAEAVFPLDEVKAAVARAEGSGRHGKILLGDRA
jgi:NADPH2:quinone reductase